MPFDLAPTPRSPRPTLREAALELMLRAQCGPGLDDAALRAELRRLALAPRPRAEALWAAYSGERRARRLSRGSHARVTIVRA